MIRKIVLLLCSICLFGQLAYAQQDKMKEINKIKRNRNYLTVTGTSTSSEEEASSNAQIMLVAEIDAWLKENSKEDITGYTAKAKKNISMIQTKLGKLYRAFAYVKKSDILPHYKDEIIITEQPDTVIQNMPVSSSVADTSIKTSAITDKEVSDDKGHKSNTSQNTITDVTNHQPLIAEKTTTPTPTVLSTETQASPEVQGGIASEQEEKRIVKLLTIPAVKKYMNTQINAGKIERYSDQLSELPTQGISYIIMFDYHGIARKHIRMNQATATNLSSSTIEDLEQLSKESTKGYSFIWFTLK